MNDESGSLPPPEWFQGAGASAVGNILTMVLFGIAYGLKKLCDRKSRCKSKCHTRCFDVQFVDRGMTSYSRNGNSVADIEAPERKKHLPEATD
jgi:hypothetical protein